MLPDLSTDILRIHNDEVRGQSFFQSPAWARVKSRFGWEAISFRQNRYTFLQSDFLVLIRQVNPLKHPALYFAYAPDALLPLDSSVNYTPETYNDHITSAADVLADTAYLIHKGYAKRVFSVRWDAPWCVKNEDSAQLPAPYPARLKQGALVRGAFVQPPATVILNLAHDEATLLGAMKPKTRYNIKLSAKKGVEVRDDLTVDDFYELYKTTSERNGIAIHSLQYYCTVVEAARAQHGSDMFLYGAHYQNELIAGIVALHHRAGNVRRAVYLYGASADKHRDVMPIYALQWHAIQRAREAQCDTYDLFGIPRPGTGTESMGGLRRFKLGFGGTVYERGGGFACVPRGMVSKIANTVFSAASKMRVAAIRRRNKRLAA